MIRSADWTAALPGAEAVCRRAALAAWRDAAAGPASACVVLTGDGTVRDLNRRFRRTDRATNVLSFEATAAEDRARAWAAGQPVLLGDVVVAFGTVRREAVEGDRTLADHLSHMVVHGTLHLLGYDHVADADAAVMERLEVDILDTLGIADPYAGGNGGPP
jgi:probable rRNA maturation factor